MIKTMSFYTKLNFCTQTNFPPENASTARVLSCNDSQGQWGESTEHAQSHDTPSRNRPKPLIAKKDTIFLALLHRRQLFFHRHVMSLFLFMVSVV